MPSPQLRILVPLHDPSAEDGLVRLAASLASPPWGELHLTHVVTPDSHPPAEIPSLLQRAADIALEMGIGAIPHLEEGQEVTQVIEQAISRWNCNMMLMGWKAEVKRDAVLSATNRDLTKAMGVDTLIFKDRGLASPRRILVPTGGGSHAMMGLQIAHDLAEQWGAELSVLRIARDAHCRPDDPILNLYCRQLLEDTQLQLQLLGIEAPIEVVPAPDIISPIADRARHSDLVVLGASNDWRQEEYLAGSIPDEIANQVSGSVLMVRAATSDRTSLSSILWEHTIRLDLHPKDKWDAITQMVDLLVEEKQIPLPERQKVLDAALARERQISTAMGHQTAIPHAPIPDLPGIIGCLAICPEGIDFQGSQDELTHFIFLLLTPQQNYRNYIPVLSQIAYLIRPDETRRALLECQTPTQVTALLKAQENG